MQGCRKELTSKVGNHRTEAGKEERAKGKAEKATAECVGIGGEDGAHCSNVREKL